MDYSSFRLGLGNRIRAIRKEKGITQERLAELVEKTTEHISYIERGERSPSFELLISLSHSLGVPLPYLMDIIQDEKENMDQMNELIGSIPAPVSTTAVSDQIENPIKPDEQRKKDLVRLQEGLDSVQALQRLANDYGITDIFQDNGGKVLQLLILLGLKQVDGREGNDAKDEEGKEYELKTINISLRKTSSGVTTHHHMNKDILNKYRKVKAWYIGIYRSIELAEIWEVHPSILESLFQYWEDKIDREGIELNNPKIPLKLVRTGKLVYPEEPVLDQVFESKIRSRFKKIRDTQPGLPGLE